MKVRSGFRVFEISIILWLIVSQTFALTRDRLYPYDGSATLQTEANGIVASAEVELQTPINLFDQEHKTIFVNANGVLSFLRPMNRFFNIPFPLDDPSIAPLYTHVDIRSSGTIYYKETNATEIVSRAGGIVRSVFRNARDFVPKQVFLVTWIDVGYFNEKKDKVNTFQVAVSSNGTHSFVEFLYPDNGIQWIRGESHPNGLPDATAQAGIIGDHDQFYALPGSGTDQIQNIDKRSNIHRPGHWVLQIGPVAPGTNVKLPDNLEDRRVDQRQTCREVGSLQCHIKAICNDFENGFCCTCKPGFYGNGKSCLENDIPLRVIGKVSGKINEHKFEDQDLQSYVQTKDGRTYTAFARVPESIGDRLQLLTPLSEAIGWLFAKTQGDIKNGYQMTGGVFNHTAEIVFEATNDKVTIHSRFLGLDVFRQLKLETEVNGYLPFVKEGDQIEFEDYQILLTRSQPGTIRSNSKRTYKLADSTSVFHNFNQDHTIHYDECIYAPFDQDKDNTMRLKFSRGVTMYEKNNERTTDNIVRFAMNSKIGPLEEEDPCLKGRQTCGPHSLCVADNENFRCVCDHGFQQQTTEDGSLICMDINECRTSGMHACSRDATCINTEGSFTCSCKPGYFGDGQFCEKMNSCGETVCDGDKQCVIMGKSPVCVCPPGTEEIENRCIPVRQQSSCDVANDCSPLATCDYSAERQSYVCTCSVGYLGNGYDCYPDQDAGIIGGGNSPIPNCQNHLCWCPPGWDIENNMCLRDDNSSTDHGSGEMTNEPTDECQDDQDCDKSERCTYLVHKQRFECTCQPGYSMVNGECVSADCAQNPSMCHANGQCVSSDYDLETYQCVCAPGYTGDGIHRCDEPNAAGCNEVNNCGNNAVCAYNKTSSNYTCVCLPGFDGDGYECVQKALSCRRDPSICSRDATCVLAEDGDFACMCNDGFTGDGYKCRPAPKQEANFLLVNQGMATHKIPFYPSNNKPGNSALIAFSQMAIGVDIDCPRKKVFVSDVSGNKVSSMTYNGSKSETFISKVAMPEGIAIDWVSRVIFWTDAVNKTIEVAHLETKKRKVLFAEGLHNPRGIAVHPYRGKIFWTDWHRPSPKIEWANEDGSGRLMFLEGRQIRLPNSLAIDWYSDEVCWTDAGTFSISCANIDTKVIRVIIKDLTYPFGLTVSPDNFYWTDWKTDKIGVVTKNGEKRPSIPLQTSGSGKLYGIVYVPETCPRVSNACQYENGRCSADQLCLPDGQGSRTCVCADDAAQTCTNSLYYQ